MRHGNRREGSEEHLLLLQSIGGYAPQGSSRLRRPTTEISLTPATHATWRG